MRAGFTGIIMLFIVFSACKKTPSQTGVTTMLPEPVIIYKVDSDYIDNLIVQTSEDGKSITAFPGQSDAAKQKPLKLAGGYYLKRMTGDSYLSISIDDYAEAKRDFSAGDLEKLILDEDPVTELYDCSDCLSSDTAAVNRFILEGKLSTCTSLR